MERTQAGERGLLVWVSEEDVHDDHGEKVCLLDGWYDVVVRGVGMYELGGEKMSEETRWHWSPNQWTKEEFEELFQLKLEHWQWDGIRHNLSDRLMEKPQKPTNCRHNVLAARINKEFYVHVFCVSCFEPVPAKMRVGRTYEYDVDHNVWVAEPKSKKGTVVMGRCPRGHGELNTDGVCEICGAEV